MDVDTTKIAMDVDIMEVRDILATLENVKVGMMGPHVPTMSLIISPTKNHRVIIIIWPTHSKISRNLCPLSRKDNRLGEEIIRRKWLNLYVVFCSVNDVAM